jgi:hypothetical protein
MNKSQKSLMEKSIENSKKEQFDLYLKGADSTNLKAKSIIWDEFDQPKK